MSADLEAIFAKVDADGGGTLDNEELTEAFGPAIAKELLDSFDDDGDGELSKDEFVDGMTKKYADDADGLKKKIAAYKAAVGI